jgi:type IV pilus assembly protein PilA
MIASLASITVVAVNPARQFAQARNAQRISHISTLLGAVGARIADTQGVFAEPGAGCEPVPSESTEIGTASYDLRRCLVPAYLPEMPVDPRTGSNRCIDAQCTDSGQSYATSYTIVRDATTGRITVCAPGAAEEALPGSEAYCLTR